MRHSGVMRRLAAVAAVLVIAGTGEVRAQSLPASAGSSPASDDVQQVRDELSRLRAEFDRLRQAYGERLLALEQRLAELDRGPATGPPAIALPVPAATHSDTGAATPTAVDDAEAPLPGEVAQQRLPPSSSQVFNPDTSVIGNFLGTAGKNPFDEEPPLALEEVEVAFQAIVDPFARADFYIAAGHDGVEIEEGFVTMTALPAHLLLKAGKLRAQFGKMNTLHTHRLPSADRPLVSNNLLGGHDGLSDSGFSLSHLVQNPVLFLEVTGEVYTGDSAVFQSSRRSDLAYLGRVRAYRDLTESMNLDIGTSFAFGPASPDGDHGHEHSEEEADHDAAPDDVDVPEGLTLDKRLFGLDAMFRYRPLRGATYRRLNLSTELVWSRQDLIEGGHTTAFGFFGLGEYQFARRWYIGGRVDRSARPFDGGAVDTGGSIFLTFWPTEYSQVRAQYRRINFHEGTSANEFLFQLNFSIGAHGAHIF